MKIKRETSARLTEELLETAKEMHSSGIMPNEVYERITRRHRETGTTTQPPIREDN
jgi:hypothetical protein